MKGHYGKRYPIDLKLERYYFPIEDWKDKTQRDGSGKVRKT